MYSTKYTRFSISKQMHDVLIHTLLNNVYKGNKLGKKLPTTKVVKSLGV